MMYGMTSTDLFLGSLRTTLNRAIHERSPARRANLAKIVLRMIGNHKGNEADYIRSRCRALLENS